MERATCPECRKRLSVRRLGFEQTTKGFWCEHCGAQLQFNRERSTAIMAVFFLAAIIPVGYESLERWSVLWVVVCAIAFWYAFTAFAKIEPYSE